MKNPDHIFYSLETIYLVFLCLKYLNSLMRIRDPGCIFCAQFFAIPPPMFPWHLVTPGLNLIGFLDFSLSIFLFLPLKGEQLLPQIY
jgi:hypothetical protein